MVLKKSKYGGNTGNTLRNRLHSGKASLFQNGTFIEKSEFSGETKEIVKPPKWLHDGGLMGQKGRNTVAYSLNKKKRWMLPDLMRESILENSGDKKRKRKRHVKDSEFSVVLTETPYVHSAYLTADGKANQIYYSTDSKKNTISKSWTSRCRYSNGADFTYHVSTTSSSKTCPVHTDGYIKCWKPKRNKVARTMKKRLVATDNHEEDVQANNEYVKIADFFDEEEYFEDACSERSESFDLNDFFVDKSERKRRDENTDMNIDGNLQRVNPSSSQLIKKFGKRLMIWVEPTDMLHEQVVVEEQNEGLKGGEGLTDTLETTCKVSEKFINPKYLRERFGRRFLRNSAEPVTFLILENLNLNSAKVFITPLDESEEMRQINIKLAEFSASSVEKLSNLINKEVKDMDAIFTEFKIKTESNTHKNVTSSFLGLFQCKAEVFNEEDTWSNVLLDATKRSEATTNKLTQSQSECEICLSSGEQLIRLNDCGHSACSKCWETFVNDRINSGTKDLTCLAYKCSVTLDIVTALSLLNERGRRLYAKLVFEGRVLGNNNMKFCENCECIAVTDGAVKDSGNSGNSGTDKTLPVVKCKCRQKWCFACARKEHWPATCEAFRLYQKQIRADVGVLYNERGELYSVTVSVKRCPFCNRQMEKNGGCNHISCVCGNHFCFQCLKPMDENHTWSGCQAEAFDEHVFTSLSIPASRAIKLRRLAYSHASKARRQSAPIVAKGALDPCKRAMVSAYRLQVDSRRLIVNLTVARSVSRSKYSNIRKVRFVEHLEFLLLLLENEVNSKVKSEKKVRSINASMKCVQRFFQRYFKSVV